MSGWPDLVSTALLGTERREPSQLADSELELGPLVGEGTAEERLLSAAGAFAVYRRAGRVATPAPQLAEPAQEEALPVCGPAAVGRLGLLLEERRELLPEWLRALAGRGLRAPAERLPDLLELATASRALRNEVEAVLGARGQWLAAQEPRWAWTAPLPASEEDREALWSTGERPQRRRLFALLRGEQPAPARALLERAWGEEEAEDRASFLGALTEGLSLADEPLLERALGDRRQEVRAAAAALLSRLPASAFGQRMRARALALVRVEGGIRKRLQIALPEELDEAMAGDGIARKPPRGTGQRAWWLLQIVAATPLASWDELGLSAEQAANVRANDELELPLREGFARAALSQRNPLWATAFLEHEPALAELVSPERGLPIALKRLAQGDREIAERLAAPWPRKPSEQALDLLVKLLRRGDDWQGPRVLAERMHPTLAEQAAKRLGRLTGDGSTSRLVEEILTTLTFRYEMHEELR